MFELGTASGRLDWLEREMEALLRGVMPERAQEPARPAGYPALNAWEDSENTFVEAELPGMAAPDLELSVVDQTLILRGERKSQEPQGVAWHRRERVFGKFERVFELPALVDSEKVTAEFTHGVLTITLPKAGAAKPRRIEVKRNESQN
jgi:HSP20 family protein